MIYLDHSATTPVRAEVIEVVTATMQEYFGNPSAVYANGRDSAGLIRRSRRQIATTLGVDIDEILFTSGATESNSTVLLGTILNHSKKQPPHIITTPLEHPSVLETVRRFASQNLCTFELLSVGREGLCDTEQLRQILSAKPASLVTVCALSPDVGTIQPMAELASICEEAEVPFHGDFSQASREASLRELANLCSYATFSLHKSYGPKGIGLLLKKKDAPPVKLLTGGGQEDGMRAGTENAPLIAGAAKAVELIVDDQLDKQVLDLRNLLRDKLSDSIGGFELTGHESRRGSFHLSCIIPKADAEKLLIALDMRGVCASSGSACATGNRKPSESLIAMGYTPEQAGSSLRLTLGRGNTSEQVELAGLAISEAVQAVRS